MSTSDRGHTRLVISIVSPEFGVPRIRVPRIHVPRIQKDISEAKDPAMRGSLAAMRRAAALARKIAIQTNTGIVLFLDGKIAHIPAAQLREEEDNAEAVHH